MAHPTIFIDATTSLRWGATTAVGIVRVERYLLRTLLETYPGPLGLVIFDKDAAVFRSIAPHEMNQLLGYIYGDPDGDQAAQHKPSKIDQMRRLGHSQMVQLSGQFFDSRIKGRMQAAGVPPLVTRATAVAFRNTAAAASVLVKLLPNPAPTTEAAPVAPDIIPDRHLAVFENYRDRRANDVAWLVFAGLTWDYMYYPHLHALRKSGRLKAAHVVYDTIPVDFPQFVPHAGHIYHRHFVEIAQTAHLLYAISEHSAERFTKAILEPNLLEGSVHSHGLPDFLAENVETPKPVPRLNGRPFAVFCSTIEARKNHGLLLAVWKRLLRSGPRADVPTLVLVGKWGWAFEAVKNQIELDPDLAGHVVVLSNLSDSELVWLYQKASFTLFPSFSEGWGLAVSESLYHGTPVVMSTAPALTEAAQGLMPQYEPDDVVTWTQAIKKLIEDPAALDALRVRAKDFKPIPVGSFAAKLTALMVS
jgi:glycosyltransferase involved in cell wall biosynthesis